MNRSMSLVNTMIFDELTNDKVTEEHDAAKTSEQDDDRLPQLRSYREHQVHITNVYIHSAFSILFSSRRDIVPPILSAT